MPPRHVLVLATLLFLGCGHAPEPTAPRPPAVAPAPTPTPTPRPSGTPTPPPWQGAAPAVAGWLDASYTWVNDAGHQDTTRLQRMAAEARRWLANAGQPANVRAWVWYVDGLALGRLAIMKVNFAANGAGSIAALQQATKLDPASAEIALTLSRTVLGIAHQWAPIRWAVSTAAGFDLDTEARRDMNLLAGFPTNATAQVVRGKLADFLGDRASVAKAEALLARLDPRVVAAARADVDDDTSGHKAHAVGAKQP